MLKKGVGENLHNIKTLRFWVDGISASDQKALRELGQALAAAHVEYVKEVIRLTWYNDGERVGPADKLSLGRKQFQDHFRPKGFYGSFGNTYTKEVADKDFRRQIKDIEMAIRTGGASSVRFSTKHAVPDLQVGVHCDVIRTERAVEDSPVPQVEWVMTTVKIKVDEGKAVQAARRWVLVPQTNRGRRNARYRGDLILNQMAGALRVARVRLIERQAARGDGNRWEAQVVIWTPLMSGSESEEQVVCGVDIGMNNLLVAAIPSRRKKIFLGRKEVQDLWMRHDELEAARRVLYLQGKRRARLVKGHKLSNVRRHNCELISRRFVDWCVMEGVTHVQMQNLTGIRRKSDDPVWNRRLSRWPYFFLQQRIEQKLQAAGITCQKVPAAGKSITCPRCGHKDKENRKGSTFLCLGCGFTQHADVVGADNTASYIRPPGRPRAAEVAVGEDQGPGEMTIAL